MMKQVVLSDTVLIGSCLKELGSDAVGKLFELAREKIITLWAHPHAVSHSIAQCRGDQPHTSLRMTKILKTIRLLPAPAEQLERALSIMQAHSDDSTPLDIIFLLSIIAAKEYLENFHLVSLKTDRDSPAVFPEVRGLTPEACLTLLHGSDDGPTPFVDLKTQQHEILPVLESNIFQVIRSCRFILGPEVEALEKQLSEYVQMEHVISCSSGTEALVLALLSLDIGPGDAVFTTPFTFIATAGAICQTGAVPVFVDIDSRTFNLDPRKLEITIIAMKSGEGYPLPQGATGLRPRAVISVDLFGLPADHQRITEIAVKHGLVVIEDAAQSFGGEERGRKACTLGKVGCTSFFPAKPLGGYGEGGACFTSDISLAEAMRSIRVHGQGTSRYEHARLGTNARLDSLQAAVLLAKMSVFPDELQRRTEKAALYSRLLDQETTLQTPYIPEGFASAWAQYSLLAQEETLRDACRQALRNQGIPTMVYYPIPLHLQRVFASSGYQTGDFPVAEQTSRLIFSLPMHPYLPDKTQKRIATILGEVSAAL
jgi:dTDP-4-amino-4,6-dideoxygalactose transaminase